ncbi:hypothetical protein MXE38_04270 [Anaerobiospirillum sp. NML120448]|uniref:hypothetical protein n=1 Tax=Anaerobiospirillum sp. NML120448 TaxID=2932816 RepID=UPI001FF1E606|nr:hypothetical protein [Anaerobiospirillum sp. NML120448]MCK0514080.1 hypothetical protein [Anaerobiospirillum sp. NML120448]
MKLSEIYKNTDLQTAMSYFCYDTMQTALSLYEQGWTVIGSQFKSPKVAQWSTKSREELIQQAYNDFQQGKANSINLRLKDSDVIAFDCDFNDPALMRDFIEVLPFVVGIQPDQYFTCSGGKGGKVFFKHLKPTYGTRTLPAKLGLTAFNPQDNNSKQELEIKRHVSTVFGMHSPIVDTSGNVIDFKIYSNYGNTKHIAAPNSLAKLPIITFLDVGGVEFFYNNLLKHHDYVDSNGKPVRDSFYEMLVLSSIFYFARELAMDKQTNDFLSLKADWDSLMGTTTIYKALGMHDGLECINYLFYGDSVLSILPNDWRVNLCKRYQSMISSNDYRLVLNQCCVFESLVEEYRKRLRNKYCILCDVDFNEADKLSLQQMMWDLTSIRP